mmetsp:Transcript_18104/g.16197  ORF Transcript_18104/g.16197 Transcript_18104/m.16197 type:complete len:125 (+) Transcript_18104:82-456(+)
MLISDVTDEEVEGCKNEIKRQENGKIHYLDFEDWYLSSPIYIVSFVKKQFDEFDNDSDGYINEQELEPLLKKIVSELLSENVVKEQLDTIGQVLFDDKHNKTDKASFIEWFKCSLYFEQATRRN